MRNQWLQKNVNLNMLAARIRPFFNEADFETTVEEMQAGILIQAVSRIPNLTLRVSVAILGRPNDFSVEFSADRGGYSSLSMIVGYLTAMFGGGFLISREAEKRETLDLLEDSFWRHTQMEVANLVDSTTIRRATAKPADCTDILCGFTGHVSSGTRGRSLHSTKNPRWSTFSEF